MSDTPVGEEQFLDKITQVIEANLSDEKFGVSELASEIGMSRSNLLRKVKKLAKISVSQFIRQARLKKSLELLKNTSSNVSEVSYKVGFSSTSYFIKCFREYYGYPPGEVGKRKEIVEENESPAIQANNKKISLILMAVFMLISVFAAGLFIFLNPFSSSQTPLDKSIAVLPFKNDSVDSSNVYIVNGLMESILNHLQKINDLKVISRTSVEKYRNSNKSIPEIARELGVSYLVEGSGQKIGNQILLNVQLIDATSDKHLWAEQYNKEVKDIFKLQQNVAKNIAGQIEVVITPEVEKRINKIPTNNITAYDYFLKGQNLLNLGSTKNKLEAIQYFKKAIQEDEDFATAYAHIAIAYYLLDVFQAEKKYTEQVNSYADKALLLDSQLPESLVAKAMFYMSNKENELALPYLEKALEYNPNSVLVIHMLSDFHTNVIPNTEKYLEYALKGVQLDIVTHDSIATSYTYLHLSNAFVQSGFLKEAEMYINKSLAYNPENIFSNYVRAYILLAKNRDLEEAKEILLKTLAMDTTRLDVLQEVGKIFYTMEDYQNAYMYYQKFIKVKDSLKMNIFTAENIKIAHVWSKMGYEEEAAQYLNAYKTYAEKDKSIYKNLMLASYYIYKGDIQTGLKHLQLFSKQNNYTYWTLLLKNEPIYRKIKDHPEFERIFKTIENKFWKKHQQIKEILKKKDLI